jgi:OmpA-OmpF porin, OOP family
MRVRNILLAATMAALPVAAAAQPVTGLYLGTGAGVNIMQDTTVASIGGFTTRDASLQTTGGAAALAAVGWGFGNGLRAEFEFDYRYNSVTGVSFPNGRELLNGSEQKYGPMVNLLYDCNDMVPMVVPYIGVGAG